MSSDEDVGGRKRRREDLEYRADVFDCLSTSHLEDFILNVTDEMGADSECGGDREADDVIGTTRTPSCLLTSTPYTSDTEENTSTTSRTTGRPRMTQMMKTLMMISLMIAMRIQILTPN